MGDDVVINAPVAGAVATAGNVSIALRASMPGAWAQIAVENERDAWSARGRPDADAIAEEMRATMVTITAATFALDAWSNTLGEVGAGIVEERNDHVRIVRTIALSCAVDVATVNRWYGLLSSVFSKQDGRHALVHPPTKVTEPKPHPRGTTNTTWEAATFTAERATRAVDAMLEVLGESARSGLAALGDRPGVQMPDDPARNVTGGMVTAVEQLKETRRNASGA
jgi:hypothetical protein